SLIGANDPTYRGDLLVLRTKAELDAFWPSHSSGPQPTVDFSTDMVVVVLAGFIGSFGHRVETRRLVQDPVASELRIDFVVHGYRGGAAPPQVDETPFQILRAPNVAGTIRTEVRASLSVASRLNASG